MTIRLERVRAGVRRGFTVLVVLVACVLPLSELDEVVGAGAEGDRLTSMINELVDPEIGEGVLHAWCSALPDDDACKSEPVLGSTAEVAAVSFDRRARAATVLVLGALWISAALLARGLVVRRWRVTSAFNCFALSVGGPAVVMSAAELWRPVSGVSLTGVLVLGGLASYCFAKLLALQRLTDLRLLTPLVRHGVDPLQLTDSQIDSLEKIESSVARDQAAGLSTLSRLEGESGSGKTHLLQELRRLWDDPFDDSVHPSRGRRVIYFNVWDHESERDVHRSIVLHFMSLPENLDRMRWLQLPTWLVFDLRAAAQRVRLRSGRADVEIELSVPKLTGQRYLMKSLSRLHAAGVWPVVLFDELDRASDVATQRFISVLHRGLDAGGISTFVAFVPGFTDYAALAPMVVQQADLRSMVAAHWRHAVASTVGSEPTLLSDAHAIFGAGPGVQQSSSTEKTAWPQPLTPSRSHRDLVVEVSALLSYRGGREPATIESLRNRLFGAPIYLGPTSLAEVGEIAMQRIQSVIPSQVLTRLEFPTLVGLVTPGSDLLAEWKAVIADSPHREDQVVLRDALVRIRNVADEVLSQPSVLRAVDDLLDSAVGQIAPPGESRAAKISLLVVLYVEVVIAACSVGDTGREG